MTKTVLITGGSSGIGLEISKYFAKDGYQLLWVSLLEDELAQAKSAVQSEIPNTTIQTLALDLSQPDSAETVKAWVTQNSWRVDVLINNAGFATYGLVQETDFVKEQSMLQLNIMTLYRLNRLFLDQMVNRNSGTIINISSATAFQPMPKMSTYAATKAFVKHFSESVAEELKMQNSAVRVIAVCPAAIADTKFKAAASMDRVNTFEGLAVTTTDEVAKDTWAGFKSGKSLIVTGSRMRLLRALTRFVPSGLTQFFVRKEMEES